MKMLIGLTGRTGSGKSSAAKIFESLGAFVADCDKVAHEVLRDEIVKQELCVLFSSDILDKSGEIDRKALAFTFFNFQIRVRQYINQLSGLSVKILKSLIICQKPR